MSLVVIVLLSLTTAVTGRMTSGNFVLSGTNSEVTLGSIALSKYAENGSVELSLWSGSELYANERNLKVHLYMDTNWSKFQKATTCEEKSRLSTMMSSVSFEYVKNHKARQRNKTASKKEPDGKWASKRIMVTMEKQRNEDRVHYWYVVILDCSLEYQFQDGTIPKIEYTVNLWNSVPKKRRGRKLHVRTHLSADQTSSTTINLIKMILSGTIGFLVVVFAFYRLVETKSVHFVTFLVMTAAFMDASSSFCEILHLKWYERNGYGWYLMDGLSSHFEAMTDALLTMVLLALAAGWTMPSDVIHVAQKQTQTQMQSLISAMRNPVEGMFRSFNKAGVLALIIITAHLVLAQWGRVYNDDFDSYHDFEHLPGRILLFIRILSGLIMIAASIHTRSRTKDAALGRFYTIFGIVGTVWFQGLPLVTWICGWAVPFHLRHPMVTFYNSVCQSLTLIFLTWLVVSNSSPFHKLSRVKEEKGGMNLTDSLSNNNTSFWKLGKTKIRLD